MTSNPEETALALVATLEDGLVHDRVHDRADTRKRAFLASIGIELDEWQLACRLLDDYALRERVAAITQRADLAQLRALLTQIDDEEAAERRLSYQRCEDCHDTSDVEVRPRYARRLCLSCFDARFRAPSQPPSLHGARARAKRAGLPATLTESAWHATVAHFTDRCAYCGGPWSLVEHATPIELGGGTTIDNCLPACPYCNVHKGALILEHWKGAPGVPEERLVAAIAWLISQGRKKG